MSKYLFFFFLDWLYWIKKGGISEIQVSCGLITLTTLLPLLDSSAINILISLFFSVGGDFAGGGGGGESPGSPSVSYPWDSSDRIVSRLHRSGSFQL